MPHNGFPVGSAVTAGYKPTLYGFGFWNTQLTDQDKWFTTWDAELMRRDPRCNFGMRILRGPVRQAKWQVESPFPDVMKWVGDQLTHVWKVDLRKILTHLEYGRSGGEIVWGESGGLIQWDSLNLIHPWDLRPRELNGKVCGVNVVNVPGKGTVRLGTPKSFYVVNEPDFNKYYGRSRYEGAWIPWQEKTARHGARDNRRTWYHKSAHAGGLMRHPSGSRQNPDGSVTSYHDVAQQIVELFEAGGVMALPNDRDDKGNYEWDWTAPAVLGDLSDVRAYVEDLDSEIWQGMGIADEVVEAAESGSGWSGRSIPFIVFLVSEDDIVDGIIQAIDEQGLRPAALANFGSRGLQYKIKPQSLVPDPQQAGGGGGPEGGAPGGTPGQPPKPGQPPQPGQRDPHSGKMPSPNVQTGGQAGVPARLGLDDDHDALARAVEEAAALTDTAPSEEQKAAGNYRKGRVWLHGLEYVIENPRGSERSGKDKDGKPWSVTMPHNYGYLKRTESEADGDHIDVFLGPCPWSEVVFVVNQHKPDGRFDEHKVMAGFTSAAEARQAYLDSYSPGWKGLGGLVPMTLPQFKAWLEGGETGRPARLGHDVSGEARDAAGEWTKGGSKKLASEEVESRRADAKALLHHVRASVPRIDIDRRLISLDMQRDPMMRDRVRALESTAHDTLRKVHRTPAEKAAAYQALANYCGKVAARMHRNLAGQPQAQTYSPKHTDEEALHIMRRAGRDAQAIADAIRGWRKRLALDEEETEGRGDVESASPLADAIIERGMVAGVLIAEEIRAKVRSELRKQTFESIGAVLIFLRDVLAEYEPLLARSLSDAMLAGWLVGAREIVNRLPAEAPAMPPVPPEPPPTFTLPESEGEPVVVFPQIETAAADLAARRLLTREDYDRLDAESRQQAFTVANVECEDALETIRNALVRDVDKGGTLREFKAKVRAEADVALSDAHFENVYRTNVGQAMKRGQLTILDHPLVRDGFPYVAYESVHDARRREEHGYLEAHGLDGTNVYRADDPVVRKFWPPWSWQCRCLAIPLSIEDAAARGVSEAKRWLETGHPPTQPAYVEHPPFDLPEGWAPVRLGQDAPAHDDTVERSHLLADILGGLLGTDALKAFPDAVQLAVDPGQWDPTLHPRGKDGRFIQRASAEAVANAQQKIKEAKGKVHTTESAQDLLTSVNMLTVRQLRQLRAEHNLRAPAHLRADLVHRIHQALQAAGPHGSMAPPKKEMRAENHVESSEDRNALYRLKNFLTTNSEPEEIKQQAKDYLDLIPPLARWAASRWRADDPSWWSDTGHAINNYVRETQENPAIWDKQLTDKFSFADMRNETKRIRDDRLRVRSVEIPDPDAFLLKVNSFTPPLRQLTPRPQSKDAMPLPPYPGDWTLFRGPDGKPFLVARVAKVEDRGDAWGITLDLHHGDPRDAVGDRVRAAYETGYRGDPPAEKAGPDEGRAFDLGRFHAANRLPPGHFAEPFAEAPSSGAEKAAWLSRHKHAAVDQFFHWFPETSKKLLWGGPTYTRGLRTVQPVYEEIENATAEAWLAYAAKNRLAGLEDFKRVSKEVADHYFPKKRGLKRDDINNFLDRRSSEIADRTDFSDAPPWFQDIWEEAAKQPFFNANDRTENAYLGVGYIISESGRHQDVLDWMKTHNPELWDRSFYGYLHKRPQGGRVGAAIMLQAYHRWRERQKEAKP